MQGIPARFLDQQVLQFEQISAATSGCFYWKADKQENLLANHLIINPDNMLIADTIATAHHINHFYSKK
jgi:hypothetical protein